MFTIVKTALTATIAVPLLCAGPAHADPSTLRGSAVDTGGHRISGVVVQAVDPVDTTLVLGSDVTNPAGRFHINHLAAEEYGVFVDGSAAGYETGYLACDKTVVPTYGEACTTSPNDLGKIVLDSAS